MTGRRFLSQYTPDVAKELVGRSRSKRMRDYGCCVTAAAEAIRHLGVDPQATGVTVMKNALAAWDGVEGSATCVYAAGSAAAVVDRLAQGNGIKIGDRVNVVQPKMHDDLIEALKGGLPVMLAIDKDGDPKTTEHWCTAVALDGDDVVCGDPDGGVEWRVKRDRLEGFSARGFRYRIVGIRVVARA